MYIQYYVGHRRVTTEYYVRDTYVGKRIGLYVLSEGCKPEYWSGGAGGHRFVCPRVVNPSTGLGVQGGTVLSVERMCT
jgi:hypothetical protein